MLHVDFVATKNTKKIMKWLKNNALKKVGLNKNIHWIRLNCSIASSLAEF